MALQEGPVKVGDERADVALPVGLSTRGVGGLEPTALGGRCDSNV